jgi:hypothetical protein
MPDFNDAPKQQELIPVGTVLVVQMTIRPGGHGDEKIFKRSDTGAMMLDCEFTVVTPGQYQKRKFWQNFILDGPSKGHAKAAEISRGNIRAMLESARNIHPDDVSEEATKARRADYEDMQNLRFMVKVGIERDETGTYDDKNVILAIITPKNKKHYSPIEQIPSQPSLPGMPAVTATPATTAAKIARPKWSQKGTKEGDAPEAAE